MGAFQYEWWVVKAREATGIIDWQVKAKSKDGAIRQLKQMAIDHDEEIQRVRSDFNTVIFWETLTLEKKGYQRNF